MKNIAVLFGIILMLWGGGPVFAQVPPAELEQVIPALMDTAEVAGLSMALIQDGEVSWVKGFGVRSTVTNPPVLENTVFEAASLSKPVFAYAVMQLVERGELDLDKPLFDYLPYEDIAYDPRSKQITARMVLSHTTGFPNWRQPGDLLRINFTPGTQFSYSGEGFVYLQKVVEHLKGESLQVLMRQMVFDPLGMTQSSYVWQSDFGPYIAVGHTEDGTALDKFTPQEGNVAWSLHTTAPDFARFLVAFMGREGLAEETTQMMLTPQINRGQTINWGLGWGLQHTRDGKAFWHWGDNFGYKSFTIAYPAQRRAMVYFANSNNGMLILHALVAQTMGGEQPAVPWLEYERYDDPQRRLCTTLINILTADGVEAALQQYEALKTTYPPVAYEEDMLNTCGYRLMRRANVEGAIAFFTRNVEAFPNSYNTYDSLGEAYMENGDLDKALANYQKSVELNPGNENGRAMIRQLQAAKTQ